MTSMNVMLLFLRMRYAEEQYAAEDAMSRGDGGELDPASHRSAPVPHAQRWTPTRVLAECEAKRSLVEEIGYHQPHEPTWTLALIVARALASVYADHPDYDPRWAAAS